MRIDSFILQLLLNQFTLYKSLRFLEVIHGFDYLRVCWNDGRFYVDFLWPGTVLDPWGTVLIIGCLIERILSVSRKSASFSVIHLIFFY